MSNPNVRMRARHWRPAARLLTLLLALVVTLLAGSVPASAYWSATGSVGATTMTGILDAPTDVTVPTSATTDVPVSWTPNGSDIAPTGYFITRHSADTTTAACGSNPTSLVEGDNCKDSAVPDGEYSYTVTAVYRSWTAPSAPSATVTVVNATSLAFADQPTDTVNTDPINPAVTVELRTDDGDPFALSGVEVTLAIDTNPGDGALTGLTTAATNDSGMATFDDLGINNPGVGYTLTATSPGLRPATSEPFTVSAPPLLGAAGRYSILAGSAVVSTGSTTVSGDLGVSPGTTVTGFGPGIVGGNVHVNDADAVKAQSALANAYDDLSVRSPDVELVADLGGRTLTRGVYHSTAALALTGNLILDGQGDPDSIFIFQTPAAFNTAAASRATLINGAQASNVFWVVNGAAGTGANSFLSGTILARGAITLGASTELIGRALSRDAVTLAANTIRFTNALPPTVSIDGGTTAITKDITPTISGTSDAPRSSPVTVIIAGQSLSTTVGVGGTWSVTASALVAGQYEVVAKVRDPSGNGTAVSQTLTLEVSPPPAVLGRAGTYSVLAGTGVVSTGETKLSGDLGVSPATSITGFPPGTLDGTMHAGNAAATGAQSDLLAALADASGRTPHTEIAGDLGGRTFHVGVHHITAALALTGSVTLDGEGDPDAVFIFQTDAAFNTAAGSAVKLVNGARAANVFWVVTGAAGTGANSTLSGSILARGAITLGAGTELAGQALSRDTVTLAGNTVTGIAPAPLARRAPSPSPDPSNTDSPKADPPASRGKESAPTPTAQTPIDSPTPVTSEKPASPASTAPAESDPSSPVPSPTSAEPKRAPTS